MSDTPAIVRYTNWRGETTERRLILGDVRFGTTEWHPKPTWLITAFDLDHPAQIWKEFDLLQCDFTLRADLCDRTQDERVRALVEAAQAQLDYMDMCGERGDLERNLRAALRDLEGVSDAAS